MAGATAIQGVDDTLKKVVADAVAPLTPKPTVTVGPLDRADKSLRLNWFLYHVAPNAAYRNMEPPRTGWQTARGRPPLALQLHYLLTAFPASTTPSGDQEQFAHTGLAAAMSALHSSPIIGEGHVALSALAKPLVEPLRITLASLDLDALSKLWTAATEPLRLSVGYEVSLVIVETRDKHVAGPPVRERRVVVVPSMGPRLQAVDPPRAAAAEPLLVTVEGLTTGAEFTLAREDDDPAGPATGWPMTPVVAPPAPSGTVRLTLPRADLAPGTRRLDVTARDDGLVTGRDSIALTVVPRVTGPAAPLAKGPPVALQTAHAAPDVEVFVRGTRLASTAVTYVSPTQVTIRLAAATAAGPADVALRAGKVAGPPVAMEIAP